MSCAALCVALCGLFACGTDDGSDGPAPITPGAPGAEGAVHQATLERLLERSRERAALTCAGSWIEVFDFVHPEVKQWMTIYQFLQGKDRHSYAEPTEPLLIAREGDTAHLSLTVLWTPRLDLKIDNVPEDWDPTERIEWIETWEYAQGDWHMSWPPQDPGEFFAEHPDLLRKDRGTEQGGK